MRSEPAFNFGDLFASGVPQPEKRFDGYPKYNFVGGHNDPTRIPIEKLASAANDVLRREGQSLAMYNLGREYVANFIGSVNTWRGRVTARSDRDVTVNTEVGTLVVQINPTQLIGLPQVGDEAMVFVRPEKIKISPYRPTLGATDLGVTITSRGFLGAYIEYLGDLDGKPVKVWDFSGSSALSAGDKAIFSIEPNSAHLIRAN